MRFVHTLLAGFIFLFLFSCKKNLELGSSSSISCNDCSQNRSDHIKICFDSLLEDSRCPIGAQCVWQGRAVAKFSFTVDKDERAITLTTLHSPVIWVPHYPADTILMGYQIEFINLLPYPEVNRSHDISEYRAEVKITKQ
jgi:hypothetical protein